jgi:hypothetical protein
LNDVIRLSFGRSLRDQRERPGNDTMSVRRRIRAIVAKNNGHTFSCLLDCHIVAAVCQGQERCERGR